MLVQVRTSSKSKSKRYKPKKLRHRKVSLSSSNYDDSTSLDTSLSSSSEDNYRSRRARSSKKKDKKVQRKKAKRHLNSHECSDDSLNNKNRKRENRKIEHGMREKPYKKKKLRGETSFISKSSGSWSCSTCQGESAGSYEGEFESRRGRSERKGKEKRSERIRSGSEMISRYRARSCSSCSCSAESKDEWTEEKFVSKNNSRWLRSVITFSEEADEARELFRNDTKEEIVDDHDYPCRSNDSNDGGSKRESDQHSLPTSKENVGIGDEKVNGNADFNLREPNIRDRSYNDRSGSDGSKIDDCGGGTSESVEKKQTSEASGASLDGNDLESVLRQKALENLRKFQGLRQSSAKASGLKNKIGSDMVQRPAEKYKLVEGKPIVENAAVGANFDNKVLIEELPEARRNSIASLKNNEKNINRVKVKSVSVKHHSTFAPEKAMDAKNHSETITASASYITNKQELAATESCHHLRKSNPSLMQIPASGPGTLVATESTIVDRHTSFKAHSVSQSNNDDVKNVRTLCSAASNLSCPIPILTCDYLNEKQNEVKEQSQIQFDLKQTSDSLEPHHKKSLGMEGGEDQNLADSSAVIQTSPNKLQGEATQGSQFEQKTMSVMRGGEMVQVSAYCLLLVLPSYVDKIKALNC